MFVCVRVRARTCNTVEGVHYEHGKPTMYKAVKEESSSTETTERGIYYIFDLLNWDNETRILVHYISSSLQSHIKNKTIYYNLHPLIVFPLLNKSNNSSFFKIKEEAFIKIKSKITQRIIRHPP